MNDDEPFLRAITSSPADDSPRLIYADWLDERGDLRAKYLRVIMLVTDRIQSNISWEDLRPAFWAVCNKENEEWYSQVGPWFNVILDSFKPDRLIDSVLAIRSGTGLSLTESKAILDEARSSGPAVVAQHLTLERAERLREILEAVPERSSLGPPCRTSLCLCVRN